MSKRPYGIWHFDNKRLDVLARMKRSEAKTNFLVGLKATGCPENQFDAQWGIAELSIGLQLVARKGGCVHFFFAGEHFRQWLCECKTPIGAEMKGIIEGFRPSDMPKDHLVPFMFHFWRGDSPTYMGVWLDQYIDNATRIVMHVPSLFVAKNRGHGFWFCTEGTKETDDPDIIETRNLIASAIAYVQAFPEMVKDGIPDDLQHPNYYRKSKNYAVSLAPSLIIRDGPCPHYRIGHFRLLQSERFIKKRGQVVFVHGCFVKGQAETVIPIT